MSRIVAATALGVALACAFAAHAQEKRALELLVITAVTAEEHAEVARFYADKAKDARAEVTWHLEMGARYVDGSTEDSAVRVDQKKHCDRIAALHREMAEEYEALAWSHARKARRLEAEASAESR